MTDHDVNAAIQEISSEIFSLALDYERTSRTTITKESLIKIERRRQNLMEQLKDLLVKRRNRLRMAS